MRLEYRNIAFSILGNIFAYIMGVNIRRCSDLCQFFLSAQSEIIAISSEVGTPKKCFYAL